MLLYSWDAVDLICLHVISVKPLCGLLSNDVVPLSRSTFKYILSTASRGPHWAAEWLPSNNTLQISVFSSALQHHPIKSPPIAFWKRIYCWSLWAIAIGHTRISWTKYNNNCISIGCGTDWINESNKLLTNYKNSKSLLLYSFVYKTLNKLYGLYNLNPCHTKTDKTSSG